MLVEARWQPPEPEPDRSRFPWAVIGWPFGTIALLAAGYVTPPLIGYACLIGALYCAIECFALLVPRTGGMKDYKQ